MTCSICGCSGMCLAMKAISTRRMVREVAHELGEDRGAARARDRQRRGPQHRIGAGPLELDGDPAADDLQHRLGEDRVGDRPAVHRDEQPELKAVAVAERVRRIRIHSLRREDRAGLELARHAALDERNSVPTTCAHGVPSRAYSKLRSGLPSSTPATLRRRVCASSAIDRDEGDGDLQAGRGLAHEVVEEGRAGAVGGRQRGPAQRLRVAVPVLRLDRGGGHGVPHAEQFRRAAARARRVIASPIPRRYMPVTLAPRYDLVSPRCRISRRSARDPSSCASRERRFEGEPAAVVSVADGSTAGPSGFSRLAWNPPFALPRRTADVRAHPHPAKSRRSRLTAVGSTVSRIPTQRSLSKH